VRTRVGLLIQCDSSDACFSCTWPAFVATLATLLPLAPPPPPAAAAPRPRARLWSTSAIGACCSNQRVQVVCVSALVCEHIPPWHHTAPKPSATTVAAAVQCLCVDHTPASMAGLSVQDLSKLVRNNAPAFSDPKPPKLHSLALPPLPVVSLPNVVHHLVVHHPAVSTCCLAAALQRAK